MEGRITKIIKIACIIAGICLLLIGTGLLFVPAGLAKNEPDEIEQFARDPKNMGDALDERYEMRSENVNLKREFTDVLLEHQEEIHNEKESAEKGSKLSAATFELFFTQSRVMAEELKLWQAARMIELQSVLDSDEARGEIELYFSELLEKREQTESEIFEFAEKYRPYITDPEVKTQFDLYLTEGLSRKAE